MKMRHDSLWVWVVMGGVRSAPRHCRVSPRRAWKGYGHTTLHPETGRVFSPARLYKPTSAEGIDTVLYFSQNFTSVRCVSAVSACSVAPSAWPALASPLSKVQRLLRMCHERLSMILFAMVHGLLRLHDGVHDVSGGGRLGIQHGHTHERSKCKQNEGTTVEFASHVCLPFLVRIHCRKRL